MAYHSNLFGWDYVWRHFADALSGIVVEGNENGTPDVAALSCPVPGHSFNAVITPVILRGRRQMSGTSVMVQYAPDDNFEFNIHVEKWSDAVSKAFGAQDVQVGDDLFDSSFLIQGNDPDRIQTLLDLQLRELILLQPPSELAVLTDPKKFDSDWDVARGNHVIVYRYDVVMDKIDQLQNAYDIVTRLLKGIQTHERVGTKRQLQNAVVVGQETTGSQRKLHSPLLDDR